MTLAIAAKGFLGSAHKIFCLVEFEFVNPLAGLAMLIIGLLLMTFNYFFYGIPPVAVGVALVVYYRRFLLQLMGV